MVVFIYLKRGNNMNIYKFSKPFIIMTNLSFLFGFILGLVNKELDIKVKLLLLFYVFFSLSITSFFARLYKKAVFNIYIKDNYIELLLNDNSRVVKQRNSCKRIVFKPNYIELTFENDSYKIMRNHYFIKQSKVDIKTINNTTFPSAIITNE